MPILGVLIDAISWTQAEDRLVDWGLAHRSSYVTLCNVHVVVTASRDEQFREVINDADLAAPDGAPVAWMLRRLGYPDQERIGGPDLMWRLCVRCAQSGIPVYFFGSTEETLSALREKLEEALPGLKIAGMESPPFRPLSENEDRAVVDQINESGAALVFVGLGCPKQETWMAEHRGRIQAVMLGVGAGFDFHAGTVKRAPQWMQDYGLEWLHRLASEPGRLWRRYFVTNTIFIVGSMKQLLTRKYSES